MLAPGERLGIVVKADDLLCVATLDEGLELRSAGLVTPILILCPVPGCRLADAEGHHLDVVVIDQHGVHEVAALASRPSAMDHAPGGVDSRLLALQRRASSWNPRAIGWEGQQRCGRG